MEWCKAFYRPCTLGGLLELKFPLGSLSLSLAPAASAEEAPAVPLVLLLQEPEAAPAVLLPEAAVLDAVGLAPAVLPPDLAAQRGRSAALAAAPAATVVPAAPRWPLEAKSDLLLSGMTSSFDPVESSG